MLSTRHCASCGHEWDPPPKPAALPLTEDRIRAIVREEIAKAMPTYVFNLTGTATNEEVRSAITAAMDSPTPRGFARHT